MQCTICLHRESQQSRRPQFKFDIASSFEKVGRERQRDRETEKHHLVIMNKRKQFLKLLKHSFKRSENVTVINPCVFINLYLLYLKGLSMSF